MSAQKETLIKNKYTTSDGYSYLTKRVVVSKAQQAGKKAAKRAMSTMGFVVTVQNGWVVRKYSDGTVHQIKPI